MKGRISAAGFILGAVLGVVAGAFSGSWILWLGLGLAIGLVAGTIRARRLAPPTDRRLMEAARQTK